MTSRLESSIVAVLWTLTGAYLYFHYGIGGTKVKPSEAVIISLVAAITAGLAVFLFNLLRSRGLPDKPRRLSYKQKQQITKYLSPYSPLGEKGGVGRIVIMSYCRGVKDAEALGEDICESLRAAKWAVDIENGDLVGEPNHSKGLWLYGKGAFWSGHRPCIADSLKDAFASAGVTLHLDTQDQSPDANLVIGDQDDKCFRNKRV